MQSNLVRAINVLILLQILAVNVAQAQTRPNETQCDKTGGGLKRQDVNQFQGTNREPIGVILCDGTIYVGAISKLNSDSFTIKTAKNQFVQINYSLLKEIGLRRAVLGPSRSERVGRQVEHYLLLPFTIVECLIASCGS